MVRFQLITYKSYWLCLIEKLMYQMHIYNNYMRVRMRRLTEWNDEKNGWRGFSNLIIFLFIHLISVRRNSISISVYHNDFANEIMMTIIHEPHHFYVIRIRIFHMNLLMIKPKIVWWSRFECFAEPLVISTISRSFGITK